MPKDKDNKKVGVVKKKRDGTASVRLSRLGVDIFTGKEDLSTWTDEELLRGYKLDLTKNRGSKKRKLPTVVPREVFEELCNRVLYYARHQMTAELRLAVEKHIEVIKLMDTSAPTGPQMKAIEMLYDRVLGKPKERVELSGRLEMAPWQKAVAKGIVGTEEDIQEVIDGEIVEDGDDDALSSQ